MVRRWWRRLNGVLVLPIGTHMLRAAGHFPAVQVRWAIWLAMRQESRRT
ncbi:hypothetical protein [Streptomyces avermitilis]